MKLFIVVLRYLVSIEKIDEHRPSHLDYLDHYYKEGTFLVSGGQNPRTGGIIMARAQDRSALDLILKQDPFALHGLAEYQIFEFTPTRHAPEFQEIIASLNLPV